MNYEKIYVIAILLFSQYLHADVSDSGTSGVLIYPDEWWCHGDCPTEMQIRGFDVFLAPGMERASFETLKPNRGISDGSRSIPVTSYENLGTLLDLLSAQLLYFGESHKGIWVGVAERLRIAGVSIYLGYMDNDGNDSAQDDPYWPCQIGFECYNPTNKQIGMYINSLRGWPHNRRSTLIHELAHAYHDIVVPDGFNNQCVLDLYADSKAKGILDKLVPKLMELYHVTPNTKWDDLISESLLEKIENQEANGGLISKQPAYSNTNHAEFFAVASEALFGISGTYPFNINDQWQWDKNQWYIHRFWQALGSSFDEWTPKECELWIADN